MAEQPAVDGWGPGRTVVTEDPPHYLSQMTGFFITRGCGEQKLGMSPFAGPNWASEDVNATEENHAPLGGAFVSDFRITAGPNPAPAISPHYS